MSSSPPVDHPPGSGDGDQSPLRGEGAASEETREGAAENRRQRAQAAASRLLTGSGLARRMARSGGWTVVASVGSFAGTLVANAILARLLAPAEMGAYFLAITLVGTVTAVAALGLPRAAVRLVAHDVALDERGSAAGTVATAARLVGVAAGVAALLTATWPGRWIASTVWESPLLRGALVFVALMVAAEPIRTLLSEALRGVHDYRAVALTGEGARAVVTALLVAALAVFVDRISLRTAVVVTSLASIGVGAVAAVLVAVAGRRLPPPQPKAAVSLLAVSLPLMVHDVTTLLLNSGDLWVLGALRSPDDVAVYAAAARIVMVVRVPMFLLSQALAPTIAELHAVGDRPRLERLARGAACIAAVPTLVLVPLGALFGESVLRVVFGDFYAQGWIVLVILSLGEAANGLSGPTAITLAMTGHQRPLMICSLVAAGVTLVAEVVLAQWFGVRGVAAASAGGIALLHAMLTVVIRRRLGIWTFASPRSLRRARAAPAS